MRWLLVFGVLFACAQQQLGWVVLTDDGGADDEVAQADLSMMGFNKDNPEYAELFWTWDDTLYPGSNSGDGCSLWDLNKNGLADFALCVSINTIGAQVMQTMTQLFDCRDTKESTCPTDSQPGFTDSTNTSYMRPTSTTANPRLKSWCYVDFSADPFASVTSHKKEQNSTWDTRAHCVLYYSEMKEGTYPNGVIQPGDPQLINVCTYPSSSPTSNQKDCVVTVGNGFLVLNKWSNSASQCTPRQGRGFACYPYNIAEATCTLYTCNQQTTPVLWNFTYTKGATQIKTQVQNFGWTPLTSMPAGTWVVSEGAVPANWTQIGFTCSDGTTNPAAVVIRSGQTLVCYFVNFQGNRSQFDLLYGGTPTNPLGNVSLDTFVANRTFAPTPQPAPTPACPVDVSVLFTSCTDADFSAAACGAGCLAAANTVTGFIGANGALAIDKCLRDYNNQHGLTLSGTTMSLLSDRVNNGSVPLCPGGSTLPPSAAPNDAPPSTGGAETAALSLSALVFMAWLM